MSGGIMDFIKRDMNWIEIAKVLFKLKQKRKEIEKEENEVEKILKELSENQSSMGGQFVYSYSLRKGSIDIEKATKELNLNLEPYRRPGSKVWKLEMQLMEV